MVKGASSVWFESIARKIDLKKKEKERARGRKKMALKRVRDEKKNS